MRKVGVIGLGHVGSTVAYTLVTKGIADELVLIDTNEAKCTAEFYDLLDSLGRLDTYTKLSMNDYKALQDADVVITAFGDIKALADGGNRFLEYSFNCQQAKQVGTALKEAGFHGVLINISNPCDVITGLLPALHRFEPPAGFRNRNLLGYRSYAASCQHVFRPKPAQHCRLCFG